MNEKIENEVDKYKEALKNLGKKVSEVYDIKRHHQRIEKDYDKKLIEAEDAFFEEIKKDEESKEILNHVIDSLKRLEKDM